MSQWMPKWHSLLCVCLFASASVPVAAFDSDAYSGVWTNQTPALTLKIDGDHADLAIGGKTQASATLQYMESQLPTAPFLYFDARDESGKQMHQLYLMVSTDVHNQPRLNGYYDRVALDSTGAKVAAESFPLSLEQLHQQASAH